jgi:hypothetical protein
MNSQKRRNPYTKRKTRTIGTASKKQKKPAASESKKETALVPVKSQADIRAASSLLKKLPSMLNKSPDEMRTSINTVREWSSQMRGTMAQLEQTLSTLNNLIGMYERWSEKSHHRTAVRAAESGGQATQDKSPLAFVRSLNNIDFRQILSLLNSPLVQALLEMDEIATSEET